MVYIRIRIPLLQIINMSNKEVGTPPSVVPTVGNGFKLSSPMRGDLYF